MPITASVGALTYPRGLQTYSPGSGYWLETFYPGAAPALRCLPPPGGDPTALLNCWAETGYTIEYWIYLPSAASATNPLSFGNFTGGFGFNWSTYVDSTGRVIFTGFPSGGINTATGVITTNRWYNIAVTFSTSGGYTTIKVFVDGVVKNIQLNGSTFASSKTALSGTYSTGNPFTMGPPALGYSKSQYIDELRVSNTTRYTANYTVASAPFIPDVDTQLLCHFTNDIYDNPAAPQIIDSSLYNNGITNFAPFVTISTSQYKF